MDAGPACDYGLWTNGLDFFFIRKDQARFETRYEALADWPAAEERMGIGADSSRHPATTGQRGDASYHISPLLQLHPR